MRQIRSHSANQTVNWEISSKFPLRTLPSEGEYEPGSRGRHIVCAEITSVWSIKPLGSRSPKDQRSRKFVLDGKASTKVRLINCENNEELAIWKFEIGDDNSPGCHFHVQILGEKSEPPFPSSLPIPRLPSLLTTFGDALEFVLGELFQDEWKSYIARKASHLKRWRPIQRDRLISLLNWQKNEIESSSGSPWMTLKLAKPTDTLLCK